MIKSAFAVGEGLLHAITGTMAAGWLAIMGVLRRLYYEIWIENGSRNALGRSSRRCTHLSNFGMLHALRTEMTGAVWSYLLSTGAN